MYTFLKSCWHNISSEIWIMWDVANVFALQTFLNFKSREHMPLDNTDS